MFAATATPLLAPAWMVALFLIVLGAKLWVIRLYGSDLPFWDQWVEANRCFRPWMAGQLTAHDLFAPHNKKADQNEPHFDGERVHLIPEVKQALDAFREAGLMAAELAAGLALTATRNDDA